MYRVPDIKGILIKSTAVQTNIFKKEVFSYLLTIVGCGEYINVLLKNGPFSLVFSLWKNTMLNINVSAKVFIFQTTCNKSQIL